MGQRNSRSRARLEEAELTVSDWNFGKLYCVGCGGLRDPKYAEEIACGCCGSKGTRKTQPQFDENGELIVDPPKVKPEKPVTVKEVPPAKPVVPTVKLDDLFLAAFF